MRCGPISVPNHKHIPALPLVTCSRRERRGRPYRGGARGPRWGRSPTIARWSAASSAAWRCTSPTVRVLPGRHHQPLAARRARRACSSHPSQAFTVSRRTRTSPRMPAAKRPSAHVTPIAPGRRWPWLLAVGTLLAVALLLRLWGVKQGLPYAYNVDENAHYVPRAIGYVRPLARPALLRQSARLYIRAARGVRDRLRRTGRRRRRVRDRPAGRVRPRAGDRRRAVHDRRVAAVRRCGAAVLPPRRATRGHPAGGRVPAGLHATRRSTTRRCSRRCVSPCGRGRNLRFGRIRDCAWAGVGVGLTCATKYTGGIVVLPVLGAIAVHATAGRARRRVAAWAWRALGVMAAVAIVRSSSPTRTRSWSWHAFTRALRDQSLAADDVLGKLGLTQRNGYTYYLWTFTWGLGWVPLAAAIALAPRRCSPGIGAAAIVLVPAPVAFVIFMGAQSRHFGRWLLPVFPIVCCWRPPGGVGGRWLRRPPRPAARRAVFAAAALALCLQSAIHSVHSGVGLVARGHARAGARVAGRPRAAGDADRRRADRARPVAGGRRPRIAADGARRSLAARSRRARCGNPAQPPARHGERAFRNENYERTLVARARRRLRARGVLLGRHRVDAVGPRPDRTRRRPAGDRVLPHAGAVAARSRRASRPTSAARAPVRFNFDWSFDTYPLAYPAQRTRGRRSGTYREPDCTSVD